LQRVQLGVLECRGGASIGFIGFGHQSRLRAARRGDAGGPLYCDHP
jgi:hypothetical protein